MTEEATALATREEDQGNKGPATTESATILQVIERAAANPEVDIEKMERLLQMHERIMARNAKAEYDAAMAEMQPKLPVITERGEIKNKAGGVQSTYAKWEDINEAIRPLLSEYGFSLTFRVRERDDDKIVVVGVLSHRSGHSEETPSPVLMADTSGSKNAIQALGSSVSYGKRYTAQALLNITSRGEDDDGQLGWGQPISAEEKQRLIDKIKETGADTQKFLNYLAVSSLDVLPAKRFDQAMKALEEIARKRAEKERKEKEATDA